MISSTHTRVFSTWSRCFSVSQDTATVAGTALTNSSYPSLSWHDRHHVNVCSFISLTRQHHPLRASHLGGWNQHSQETRSLEPGRHDMSTNNFTLKAGSSSYFRCNVDNTLTQFIFESGQQSSRIQTDPGSSWLGRQFCNVFFLICVWTSTIGTRNRSGSYIHLKIIPACDA